MTFGNPLALLLALLAVPIVALSLRPAPVLRFEVATGFLWQRVARRSMAAGPWRRLRRPVGLAVQLAGLGLLTLGAADPHVPPPRTVVLLVDTSASMAATDATPNRLAGARRAAREWIASMRPAERMAIVRAGAAVGVACPLTGDQARLCEALESLAQPAGPTRIEDGLAAARRLLADRSAGRIIVFTDAPQGVAGDAEHEPQVEIAPVGTSADNLAITGLSARRLPLDSGRAAVWVEVRSCAADTQEARLHLGVDGKTAETWEVRPAPGERWSRVFELEVQGEATVSCRLDRDDALAEDNAAQVTLPEPGRSSSPDLAQGVVKMHRAGLPPEESDLCQGAAAGRPGPAPPTPSDLPPLWFLLAAAGGIVLLTESWLFHRRWLG